MFCEPNKFRTPKNFFLSENRHTRAERHRSLVKFYGDGLNKNSKFIHDENVRLVLPSHSQSKDWRVFTKAGHVIVPIFPILYLVFNATSPLPPPLPCLPHIKESADRTLGLVRFESVFKGSFFSFKSVDNRRFDSLERERERGRDKERQRGEA